MLVKKAMAMTPSTAASPEHNACARTLICVPISSSCSRTVTRCRSSNSRRSVSRWCVSVTPVQRNLIGECRRLCFHLSDLHKSPTYGHVERCVAQACAGSLEPDSRRIAVCHSPYTESCNDPCPKHDYDPAPRPQASCVPVLPACETASVWQMTLMLAVTAAACSSVGSRLLWLRCILIARLLLALDVVPDCTAASASALTACSCCAACARDASRAASCCCRISDFTRQPSCLLLGLRAWRHAGGHRECLSAATRCGSFRLSRSLHRSSTQVERVLELPRAIRRQKH